MATVVVGGFCIGVDFALTILGAIGVGSLIGLAGAGLKEVIENHIQKVIREIQSSEINSFIDAHVMNKKHKFNDFCNESCILYVAHN